ncbi:hypothetical protein ILT44_03150 [Microvirga sp. BT689]|uniref:hypothetical protein n=1 Tax=Microvirga arvi TaxID=2778731 RepID=UPI001950B4E7|nr:hypothetical protein [Microvirga arvi]MBM6579169.1 hypothetical protein [Microvirga arvi]
MRHKRTAIPRDWALFTEMLQLLLFLILMTLLAAFFPFIFGSVITLILGVIVIAFLAGIIGEIVHGTSKAIRGAPAALIRFKDGAVWLIGKWAEVMVSPITEAKSRWRELRSDQRKNGKRGLVVTLALVAIAIMIELVQVLVIGILPLLLILGMGATLFDSGTVPPRH